MPFKLSKTDLQDLRDTAEILEEEKLPKRYAQWVRICKRAPVYLDKERFLVLKLPGMIVNKRTPLELRVPTIKVDSWGWVVQPYVDKTRTKLAVELIRKQLGEVHCDLHHRNVGWWNGKPLLFDW